MNEAALLHNSLILGAILFGVGLVGMLTRRNMIVMFLCAEMMLQGVAVSLLMIALSMAVLIGIRLTGERV